MNQQTYYALQVTAFSSHESVLLAHADGQRQAIQKLCGNLSRDTRILDLGCGDGVGLHQFRRMGFADVVGVDINPRKAQIARSSGYPVYELDMHELPFPDTNFAVVWCSFALEHAHDPAEVLRRCHRALSDNGTLYMLTSYPDRSPELAHPGATLLGTRQEDNGRACAAFCESQGFVCEQVRLDQGRSGALWLTLTRA